MLKKRIETKLEFIDGYKFNVKYDLDYIPNLVVDEIKPDGEGLGPNPPRLLATAVGHCMTSSLIYCLKKARIRIEKLETSIITNLIRNKKGRLRISDVDIQIFLKVHHDDESRVHRCLTIFEDYCTVTQSIRRGIEVSVDIK